MDQVKIGKFISECRKKNNLTQMQLAEKLNITDRAISKWENGNCMPDSGIIPELCKILNITINELFSGEIVDMKKNKQKLEENLLEMVRIKEENDKSFLHMEILIGIISIIPLLISTIIVLLTPMKESLEAVIIVTSLIPLLIATPFALRIEQTAGYYKCKKCNHEYVPTYQSVFWAMHYGRTRYMKCPKCNKRSWQKKIINKE